MAGTWLAVETQSQAAPGSDAASPGHAGDLLRHSGAICWSVSSSGTPRNFFLGATCSKSFSRGDGHKMGPGLLSRPRIRCVGMLEMFTDRFYALCADIRGAGIFLGTRGWAKNAPAWLTIIGQLLRKKCYRSSSFSIDPGTLCRYGFVCHMRHSMEKWPSWRRSVFLTSMHACTQIGSLC